MPARGRRQCGRTPARPAVGKRCIGGVNRQPLGRTASPRLGVLRPDVGTGWAHAGRRPGSARAPGRPRHLTAGFLTVPLADPLAGIAGLSIKVAHGVRCGFGLRDVDDHLVPGTTGCSMVRRRLFVELRVIALARILGACAPRRHIGGPDRRKLETDLRAQTPYRSVARPPLPPSTTSQASEAAAGSAPTDAPAGGEAGGRVPGRR
jgi:hypothetical protein